MTIKSIKPVSYIWRRLLEENQIPLNGVIVEVAPGYETKIGDALNLLKFKGTIILIEPDKAAATYIQRAYKKIMPVANVKIITKPLQDVKIGVDIPLRVDALVANHPFDDMAIAFAMHEKSATFFSKERKDGTDLKPSIKELYDSVSNKDYIHGILATMVVWKDFVQKLKPDLFIASQYPSHKLALKKLNKRQNSGLIIIEMLRDYYENYLKNQYRDNSFGQQGDPAWWIVARKPYVDLASDLSEKPDAMKRLGEKIFVPQKTKRLNVSDYDIIYANSKYFQDSGYGGNALQQAQNFAIILDKKNPFSSKRIITYADRQKDLTQISLSGNLGSGRAVYYGKKHNVMGVGKTTLCISKNPSHSTGQMELVGSLRRVVLSRWINYFTKNVVQHPVVISLKKTAQFKWNKNPIPLALLVRVDDGALDRPSHVECLPDIKIDFHKTLDAYAKLDAQYFSYRFMLGAWSTGNYSLDGRIIDLEATSFVKYRGPYNTVSAKYHETFFGYEGFGFIKILKQLASVKGIKNINIEERFYKQRRQYLAQCLLSLLGADEARSLNFFHKYSSKVMKLADQFERLSKKISPKKTSLSLRNGPISDADDPSLLDMSNLFMNLAGLYKSSSCREKQALNFLIRKNALAEVRPDIIYKEQLTKKGEINFGEIFIKENAVVTYGKLRKFLSETKKFVHKLFQMLDNLYLEKCLPKRSHWKYQLETINQDFPTMDELDSKLKYWVEEYRLGNINPETLGLEVEKLCQLPNYLTGKNLDLEDISLIDYLKPNRHELKILSTQLKPVNYKQGEIIIREGEDADSLFILIQGTCKVIVGKMEISKITNRGALIGEAVVLKNNRKRTASVVAETPARLLQISRAGLKEMAISYPKIKKLLANMLIQRREGIADKVCGLEIFAGINPEELRLFLADKAFKKYFRKNQKIIQQNKKTKGVYLIVEGSVILRQSQINSKIDSIELKDAPLVQGILGERSTLFDKGAVCDVLVNSKLTTLFIPKNDFRGLVDRHPQLLRNCLDHISDYSLSNKNRASLISKLVNKIKKDRY